MPCMCSESTAKTSSRAATASSRGVRLSASGVTSKGCPSTYSQIRYASSPSRPTPCRLATPAWASSRTRLEPVADAGVQQPPKQAIGIHFLQDDAATAGSDGKECLAGREQGIHRTSADRLRNGWRIGDSDFHARLPKKLLDQWDELQCVPPKPRARQSREKITDVMDRAKDRPDEKRSRPVGEEVNPCRSPSPGPDRKHRGRIVRRRSSSGGGLQSFHAGAACWPGADA